MKSAAPEAVYVASVELDATRHPIANGNVVGSKSSDTVSPLATRTGGKSCVPDAACQEGQIRCADEGPVCDSAGPLADGTACGDGVSCLDGACERDDTGEGI